MIARLLIRIKFEFLKESYDLKHYNKIREFLYELNKNPKYFNKHDSIGYKLYCSLLLYFQNISNNVAKEADKRLKVRYSINGGVA